MDTQLHEACFSHNENAVESVKKFLDEGGDIEIKSTHSGWTLLMVACRAGTVELVRFLLDRGAYMDYQDPRGNSPMMIAFGCYNNEHGKELLIRGAFYDAINIRGDTVSDFVENSIKPAVEAILETLPNGNYIKG